MNPFLFWKCCLKVYFLKVLFCMWDRQSWLFFFFFCLLLEKQSLHIFHTVATALSSFGGLSTSSVWCLCLISQTQKIQKVIKYLFSFSIAVDMVWFFFTSSLTIQLVQLLSNSTVAEWMLLTHIFACPLSSGCRNIIHSFKPESSFSAKFLSNVKL